MATGDVFFRDVKPIESPRGSIVPPGCTTEEVDGEQILRISAGVTEIATPIIFPTFSIVIESPRLAIDGDTIQDAALYAVSVRAPDTDLSAVRELEVTGLMQVRSVRGRTVRAGRIEARRVEADLSVRATEAVVAKQVSVKDGSIRTPKLVSGDVTADNQAVQTVSWDAAAAAGEVPDWLRSP